MGEREVSRDHAEPGKADLFHLPEDVLQKMVKFSKNDVYRTHDGIESLTDDKFADLVNQTFAALARNAPHLPVSSLDHRCMPVLCLSKTKLCLGRGCTGSYKRDHLEPCGFKQWSESGHSIMYKNKMGPQLISSLCDCIVCAVSQFKEHQHHIANGARFHSDVVNISFTPKVVTKSRHGNPRERRPPLSSWKLDPSVYSFKVVVAGVPMTFDAPLNWEKKRALEFNFSGTVPEERVVFKPDVLERLFYRPVDGRLEILHVGTPPDSRGHPQPPETVGWHDDASLGFYVYSPLNRKRDKKASPKRHRSRSPK